LASLSWPSNFKFTQSQQNIIVDVLVTPAEIGIEKCLG
jgi:hypothetical protein